MIRKIFALFAAAAVMVCMAGCSEYVMTEEELALQKSLVGYWAADVSTGYNEFSEDGALTAMTAVEFTDDFHYLMHICLLDDGYALTYPPVEYSFEDMKFKVVNEGVASFAKVTVSDDGQTMYWQTDEKTDTYLRLDKDTAAGLGIPEYSPESWVTDENGSFVNESDTEASVSESSDVGSTTDTEDNAAAQAAVNSYGQLKPYSKAADIDTAEFKFDKSVKFDAGNSGYESAPVFLAETADGEVAVYGMYSDGKEPYIFIEHDSVIDVFEQHWLTPRSILPRFMHEDIDDDGEKELAAAYYVGSGTGISVEWLVIYELEDGHLISNAYDPTDALADIVSANIDNGANTVTFTLATSGESIACEGIDEYYSDGIENIGWGSIIEYEFDGSEIIFTAMPDVRGFYECMPTIRAKVDYSVAEPAEFGLTDVVMEYGEL